LDNSRADTHQHTARALQRCSVCHFDKLARQLRIDVRHTGGINDRNARATSSNAIEQPAAQSLSALLVDLAY
jgi:hypothetical protein